MSEVIIAIPPSAGAGFVVALEREQLARSSPQTSEDHLVALLAQRQVHAAAAIAAEPLVRRVR